MNKERKKTIFAIIALVLLLSICMGMVVYIFMQSNKEKPDWELFIDIAPVDYSSQENYFSVMRFKDNTNKFISQIFNGVNATTLTDRVILSLSKARIPAEKLGTMATAIAAINVNDIYNSLNSSDITEDNILDFMQTTTMEYISQAIHKFFVASNLTEEEFSRFLYVYLSDYTSKEYLLYLNLLGKDNFISFFSNSIYLINTLSEIQETGGKNISDYALQAVFYQLGSVYTKIVNEVGVDVIEKVLCFDWHFKNSNGSENEVANDIYSNIKGRIGLIVGILGAIMQQTDVNTINAFREYTKETSNEKIKTDKLIYSQILMAKTIKDALNKLYTAKSGIKDFDDMVATYESVIKNTILLNYVINGGEATDETIVKQCDDISLYMANYSGAIKYLYQKNYSLSDLVDMEKDDYYEELLIKAKEMSSMKYSVDYFIASLINIWINYQANVIKEMVE